MVFDARPIRHSGGAGKKDGKAMCIAYRKEEL
jgi:hypothetical protein